LSLPTSFPGTQGSGVGGAASSSGAELLQPIARDAGAAPAAYCLAARIALQIAGRAWVPHA
jgi:hypothetical protein